MRIEAIKAYHLALPFKGEFSISRKKGLLSEMIIVEIKGEGSTVTGYGEGVPIRFVTGETPESVIKDILRFSADPSFPWDLRNVFDVWDFVDRAPEEKFHNAAICALETALLDMLGKHRHKPVTDFFPHTHLTDVVHYGAPLTLGKKERVEMLCKWIKSLGISRIRIKMGESFDRNRHALETVASVLGHDCQLRIDPNGVWDRELAFEHLPLIRKHKVCIVEEPMERDAEGFVEFAEALRSEGVILMACESAPTLKDVKKIVKEGFYQMINVKLCRSGGFRRSLRMIDHIRKSALSFQIGCTLGESGILSAAGRALCLLSKDAANHDGSYDRFLLRTNTTLEDVSFGPGGKAGPLNGNGLGIRIDRSALRKLAVSPIINVARP